MNEILIFIIGFIIQWLLIRKFCKKAYDEYTIAYSLLIEGMKYASTWDRWGLWEICKLLWILYKHQIQVTALLSYITICLKVLMKKNFVWMIIEPRSLEFILVCVKRWHEKLNKMEKVFNMT